jgi:hypothetical protein
MAETPLHSRVEWHLGGGLRTPKTSQPMVGERFLAASPRWPSTPIA